jgi:catechol 2,3-dioxygenase-like lactoylglutathione lyase family enzyme
MRTTAPERYGGAVAPIRLDQVNLVVSDVDVSRAFYAKLGLDFGDDRDPVWAHHHVSAASQGGADFELDSPSFAPHWNEGWSGGPGVVVGFSVDTRQAVDELVAALAADGTAVQQPPWDAFWGARYAVVSDPDGNAVGIMSPIDDAIRAAPPDPASPR